MKSKIESIEDVRDYQLCVGCGACAAYLPDELEMCERANQGRRPKFRAAAPVGAKSRLALAVCPGIELERPTYTGAVAVLKELTPAWGPVLQVWEGGACDSEIRMAGSSGGAATALALYCIEQGGMHGVLHTSTREDVPYLNETVMSACRAELLQRTGSRYAPASPAEGLGAIASAPAPCVFIGKPCDVAAAYKMRNLVPELDEKLGVTIAFFCAGTPSTEGTLALLKEMGVANVESIKSIRYRGNGWPGSFVVEYETDTGASVQLTRTYEESWGFLQRFRQWRCYICPDHSGEYADISVGDPWYKSPRPGDIGSSLILARSERGLALVEGAIRSGYLDASPVAPKLVSLSQRNLLVTRGRLWGQMLALRSFGLPRPRYRGFPMFRFWWGRLSIVEKVQSIVGTWRRVLRKALWRAVDM